MRVKLFLSVSAVCASILVLAAADRTVIRNTLHPKIYSVSEVHALPPDTTATYITDEFRFTVTTNADGFRGDSVSQNRTPDSVRILAIGDSYTYGWGVEQNEMWTQKVKEELARRISPVSVEMITVAYPGASPEHYLRDAQEFIPRYRPDIILIGLLEADDVAQVYADILRRIEPEVQTPATIPAETDTRVTTRMKSLTDLLTPNIMAYIRNRNTVDIKSLWKKQTALYLHETSASGIIRWNALDAELKDTFITGSLNPGLLYLTLNEPDHFIRILRESDPTLIRAYARIRSILFGIRTTAESFGARTYIVDIPHSSFIDTVYLSALSRLGLYTDPASTTSGIPVTSLRTLAGDTGISVIETLDTFRSQCRTDFFYPLDTHMNAKGHTIIAHIVAKVLTDVYPSP